MVAREAVRVEAIEVAAAQLAIRLAVAEHVGGDDEDAVSDGDDGLLVAAPLDEAPVLRREVAVACADGAARGVRELRQLADRLEQAPLDAAAETRRRQRCGRRRGWRACRRSALPWRPKPKCAAQPGRRFAAPPGSARSCGRAGGGLRLVARASRRGAGKGD